MPLLTTGRALRASGAQITMRTLHRWIPTTLSAVLALAVVQACGDDEPSITEPTHVHTLAAVAMAPATLELEEGETYPLGATPTCEAGHEMEASVAWTSADPDVATVDADGLVTAVLEGEAEIRAEATDDGVTATGATTLTVGPSGERIDAAGGTVSYLDGRVVLEIPEGALAEATEIVIRPSAADVAQELDGVFGTAFHFRPEGLLFQQRATLTLRYEEGDVPVDVSPDRLRLFHRTASGWEEMVESQVDPVAHEVTGSIEGFSHYGVRPSGQPAVATVTVEGASEEPIPIGGTVQLTATLRDAEGGILENRRVTWTSDDEAVATVDGSGLVTAAGRGVTNITATSEGVSGSAQVRVSGETSGGEEGGNNMSWPVVFADGVGITGQPVATDPGVRPTLESGIVVDALPFFWADNAPDYGAYYLQQGVNTWRAEYVDGTGKPPYDAEAYWGDNLTVREWSVARPIRVEVALSATEVGTLLGYPMTYVYGEGPSEMQGTDGSTAEFVPLVYSEGPSFIVEQIDGQGGSVVATVVSTTIGSEVNVGGRIIYGHQLNFADLGYGEGWYRLRFVLAEGANVRLTSVGNSGDELTFQPVVVNARETAIDIHVTP